jgi:tol-pal system-associated acyl-CoA thioesterase
VSEGAGAAGRSAVHETFAFTVRVYYEDTDAGGVVYYANYLKFMERARTEWLAALGFPLAAFERTHGLLFVVHRVEIDFLRAASLNDALGVTVEVLDRGACRLTLRQAIRRAGETITDARVELVCIDAQSRKPRRMPPALGAALENTK